MSNRKWLALALKIAVTGALIWYLARQIDFADAGRRLMALDPWMLAAAVCVLVAQMFVAGARWGAVLVAIGAPLRYLNAVRLFYIGAFFSQALPSSVGGDAVRMYKAYREGIGLRGAVNGVLLERVVTVAALVIVVGATQPWFISRLDDDMAMVALPAVLAVGAAAVVGLGVLVMLDRLPAGLMRWRVVRGLGNLGADARKVFLDGRNAALSMTWGVLTHVNISLCVFLLARGLALDVGWLDCLVLVPPVLLVMTLPISIGGWGVRETAMVALFGFVGVPGSGALALSVLVGLVGILVTLPGGIVWLMTREGGETLAGDVRKLEEAEHRSETSGTPN